MSDPKDIEAANATGGAPMSGAEAGKARRTQVMGEAFRSAREVLAEMGVELPE